MKAAEPRTGPKGPRIGPKGRSVQPQAREEVRRILDAAKKSVSAWPSLPRATSW